MPQPIDLQTELMRVTAAERVQQAVDRVSLAAQGRLAAHLQQDRFEKETRVQESRHAAQDAVDADGRGGKQGRRRSKRDGEGGGPASTAVRTFYTGRERPEIVEDPGEHQLDVTA
jgi:hypothetical protein